MAKRKAEKQSPQKQSISDRLETHEKREQAALVSAALKKLQAKQPLTKSEKSAVRAYEQEQLETWGRRYASAVPKREYCDQVDIHQKVALEQSRRFGLVYHTSGKRVDLFQQLSAWHAWASENKHIITRAIRAQRIDKEQGFDDEDFNHWDTRRVKAIALLKEHEYEERQGRMQPIELVHALLQEFFVVPMLRRIEGLEKRETSVCEEIADGLREDIKDFEAAVMTVFTNDDDVSETEKAGSSSASSQTSKAET